VTEDVVPPDGSTLKPMRVPEAPDTQELERLLTRLSVLVEIRATEANARRAQELLDGITAEIDTTLDSAQKHREWRVRRYKVLELITELDSVLYYSLP